MIKLDNPIVQGVLGALGVLFVALVLLAWLRTRLRYQITATHLEVTLFGVCLRRVALTDIEGISRHSVKWGENWWNTQKPFRRILVIRRRSGLLRNFVITPWHRYVFRAELERAIANCASSVYQGNDGGEEETPETEGAGQPG